MSRSAKPFLCGCREPGRVSRRLRHGLRASLAAASGACLFLGLQAPAWAEDDITTDRPDFVESSDVVGPGRFQLEMGLSQVRDKAGRTTETTTFTPTLLRIGLNKDWELRFESDGLLRSRTTGSDAGTRNRGYADTDVGLKWHVQDGDEAEHAPGVAWLFHAALPTGSGEYRGKGIRPSVRMVAEWDLPQGLSVGVMPGLTWDQTAEGVRFTSALVAATLAKSWNEQWRSFIELSARQIAAARHGGKIFTLDAGAAYLINRNTQLDVYVARGLNGNAPDLEVGAGLSVRF